MGSPSARNVYRVADNAGTDIGGDPQVRRDVRQWCTPSGRRAQEITTEVGTPPFRTIRDRLIAMQKVSSRIFTGGTMPDDYGDHFQAGRSGSRKHHIGQYPSDSDEPIQALTLAEHPEVRSYRGTRSRSWRTMRQSSPVDMSTSARNRLSRVSRTTAICPKGARHGGGAEAQVVPSIRNRARMYSGAVTGS
jgi:hypothetical protein